MYWTKLSLCKYLLLLTAKEASKLSILAVVELCINALQSNKLFFCCLRVTSPLDSREFSSKQILAVESHQEMPKTRDQIWGEARISFENYRGYNKLLTALLLE